MGNGIMSLKHMLRNVRPKLLPELQGFMTSVYWGLVIEILYMLVTFLSAILVHDSPSMCVPCIAVMLLLRFSQVYEDYRTYRISDWRGMLTGFTVLMTCYIAGASGVCDVIAYGCTMILGKCAIELKKTGNKKVQERTECRDLGVWPMNDG